MTDYERDYWTVVAQVVPVLALALVLEVRALRNAEFSPARRGTVSLLIFLNCLTLGSSAFSFIFSIGALETGKQPNEFQQQVTAISLGAAISLLFTNPALYILLSQYSRIIAKIAAFSPTRLRLRLSVRKTMRLMRDTTRAYQNRFFRELLYLERIGAVLDHPERWDEVTLEPLRDELDELRRYRERLYRSWRYWIVQELNRNRFSIAFSEWAESELQSERQSRQNDLQSFFRSLDTTPTSLTPFAFARSNLEADDGGFLFPIRKASAGKLSNWEKPYLVYDVRRFGVADEDDELILPSHWSYNDCLQTFKNPSPSRLIEIYDRMLEQLPVGGGREQGEGGP